MDLFVRLTPLLAALILLASQTTAQTPAQTATAPSPLIGTWESEDRSQGGMGSVMVFAADNSALAIVSVMVDARYTRNGNRIQIIDADGSRMTYTAVITGNTLRQTTPEKTVRMTRIPGTGPDTGILGKWRFTYEAPQTPPLQAVLEYRADGISRLRMALQTQAGTYSVSGSELTLRFPNAPTETRPFSRSMATCSRCTGLMEPEPAGRGLAKGASSELPSIRQAAAPHRRSERHERCRSRGQLA